MKQHSTTTTCHMLAVVHSPLVRRYSKSLLTILVVSFLLFLCLSTHAKELGETPNFQSADILPHIVSNAQIESMNTLNTSIIIITSFLEAPLDVALMNYNVTEFAILVGNVTYNLTIAQSEIVMTNGNNLVTLVTIVIRALTILLLNCFLIACIVLLRNYEPIKSKLFVSLILVGLNTIGQFQGTIDYLPMIRMFFESYWNQFLLEKKTHSIDAATFYQNNLNANGLPTWMVNYITFENVYCFISEYVIYGLVICSIALYSIQMIKFLLLTLLKDKRQQIMRSLEEFKRRQLEKLKNIKLQTNNKDQQKNNNRRSVKKTIGESSDDLNSQINDVATSSSNNLMGPLNIDLSVISQSTNSESNTPRPLSARSSRASEIEDNSYSSLDYDEIALDLATDDDAISSTYEEISKQGKFVNLLKKLIKYRIIEISYIAFWVIIWFVIISISIASRKPDKWGTIFYSWDQYSGYCRKVDRDEISYYALIILFILFLAIPLFLIVDFIFAVYNYIKVRKVNKEKGERTENFLIYYFYETDPFVYRLESISILFFDILSVVLLLLIPTTNEISSQLASSLIFAIVLNIFGGSVSNPGITVMRGIWNYFIALRAKRKDSTSLNDSNTIQNIQQLITSPISSFTIDYVISHKKERELFYQYLREEYSVENLLFVEDVIKLNKMNEKHVRSKIMKIKEITKLYLSESHSVFEINVPSKVIQTELKDYKELMNFLNVNKLKVNQLPRVIKDSSMRYFPNIDLSKEEIMKPLILNLCKPNIFTILNMEVYKNLLDSYYRFNNSRKWKEYLATVVSP